MQVSLCMIGSSLHDESIKYIALNILQYWNIYVATFFKNYIILVYRCSIQLLAINSSFLFQGAVGDLGAQGRRGAAGKTVSIDSNLN